MFTFGTKLKKLREEKGITQQQLADLLHVGRPTIAGYETKGKEPDFDKIVWLAKYFDVTVDYLLGETDERTHAKKSIPSSEELEILKRKFIKHGIIKEDEDLTSEQLDDYLKKLSAIISAFKD